MIPHPSLVGFFSLFSRHPSKRRKDAKAGLSKRNEQSRRNRFKHAMQFELLENRLVMADPDDAISEAFLLGAISTTPKSVSASISPDTDVNMVGFTVSAGQTVDFDIDTPLNGPGGLGSYIRLFNSQGTQLAFNNDGTAPGENKLGFDSYLRYTFVTADKYYLGVSNLNNIQYDPLTGNGDVAGGRYSIGSYQLIIQTAAVVLPDPNDAISEAFALGAVSTTPSSVSAAISPDTDVNMVSFIVTAGQVVDFDIDTTLNGKGGLGSYVRLFNAQGVELASNNDGLAPGESALGFDAYLRYTFVTAGTYYLGVSNFNNIQYNALTGDGDTPICGFSMLKGCNWISTTMRRHQAKAFSDLMPTCVTRFRSLEPIS